MATKLEAMRMIRLAHFSDVHLISPRLEWKLKDWFSKRLTSWFNYRFRGRALQFAFADDIVPRLMDDLLGRGVDHLVFSGDATVLGFESEIRRAAEVLRVGQIPIPGLAVPGNHDYLTRASAASGVFEQAFAPWQVGRRIGAHAYPFAQRVGAAWLADEVICPPNSVRIFPPVWRRTFFSLFIDFSVDNRMRRQNNRPQPWESGLNG
jgi:3',5'-cyclic AMP phosphodiesterase CpdA